VRKAANMSRYEEALASSKFKQAKKTNTSVIVKDYLQAVPEYDDTDKFKDGPEQIKEIYETTLEQLDNHCNLINTQFRDTHYDQWTPKPKINTYEVNDFARKVLLEQMFKNTSLGAELDMLKRAGSVKLNSF
jgi:hypothetical protein